jgi:hypothetical protein
MQLGFGKICEFLILKAISSAFHIFKKISTNSGKGNLDVSDYFTQLKVFWDELENYRPIPVCSCAIACSCGAITSVNL